MRIEDIAWEKIVGGMEFVFVVDARRFHFFMEFRGRAVAEMLQNVVAGAAAGMEAERVETDFFELCKPIDTDEIVRCQDDAFS